MRTVAAHWCEQVLGLVVVVLSKARERGLFELGGITLGPGKVPNSCLPAFVPDFACTSSSEPWVPYSWHCTSPQTCLNRFFECIDLRRRVTGPNRDLITS
jgi:hypothetical protein